MRRNTNLKIDYYNAEDGLSQDEFRRMRIIMQLGFDEMDTGDMVELVGYFKRIIEAKDRQIADLNEELYQKTFKKKGKENQASS